MKTQLHAATDVATFILFDPGAITADSINPRKPFESINEITSRGQAICYSYASDGDTDCLILVDEEPDQELLDRQQNAVENVLLHVPTGRLVATGFEDLCRKSKQKYCPETFVPVMGHEVRIPVGSYVVKAFEVDWEGRFGQEITDRAIPGDERFETTVVTSMGCVFFSSILAIPAGLAITWYEAGLQTALRFGMYVLLFEIVFWAIAISVVRFSKSWKRMAALRLEVDAKFPGTVFVLRMLHEPDTKGSFNAGKFGGGFATN